MIIKRTHCRVDVLSDFPAKSIDVLVNNSPHLDRHPAVPPPLPVPLHQSVGWRENVISYLIDMIFIYKIHLYRLAGKSLLFPLPLRDPSSHRPGGQLLTDRQPERAVGIEKTPCRIEWKFQNRRILRPGSRHRLPRGHFLGVRVSQPKKPRFLDGASASTSSADPGNSFTVCACRI